MDSFEVKIRGKNKKVMAKMLHRCLSGVIDFYTPEGKEYYSETYNQKYIVPNEEISCLFVKLAKKEYVILGFYDNTNSVYDDSADIGCYKLTDGVNSIQYGNGLLKKNIQNK